MESEKKLKIGAFVGKFYPPHLGHLSVIDRMCEEMDELFVIISYKKSRNDFFMKTQNFKPLSPELIKSWFEEHYRDKKNIKIAIFDETDLENAENSDEKWSKKFKEQFPTVNIKIADESYRKFNEEYFPECEFYPIDRDKINVHSTPIRDDIKNNLDNIIFEARKYFEEN